MFYRSYNVMLQCLTKWFQFNDIRELVNGPFKIELPNGSVATSRGQYFNKTRLALAKKNNFSHRKPLVR